MENSIQRVSAESEPVVGIVVPTLGTRSGFLNESISSIRSAGNAWLVLVCPSAEALPKNIVADVDEIIEDPNRGLAAAINAGINTMPPSIKYISWLGDDDRLLPGALSTCADELVRTQASAVFGQCWYIDEAGGRLWMNKSGKWAVPMLRVGPQLIPQPGSLVLRSAFDEIGQLSESLKWAFDLEMFIQLSKHGNGLQFLNVPLAEFRWHEGSLSVGGRKGSVDEASRIRVQHLPRGLKQLSVVWEPIVRLLILFAGRVLSQRQSRFRPRRT